MPDSRGFDFLTKGFTWLSACLILGLISCQPLKPYQWPATPVPESWKLYPASAESNASPDSEEFHRGQDEPKDPHLEACNALENWWEIFEDPILNQLEEQALSSSYTLWAALERVIEARASAQTYLAPLMPSIGFAPSYSRTGSLIENPIPGIGGSSGAATDSSSSLNAPNAANTFPALPNSFRYVQTQYLVPFNFSYEVDLWNQLNNAYFASLMRAQASSQAYLSVLLSLTSDIASSYFQIRSLDAQLQVIERSIEVRQHAVDINQSKYDAGLIVFVDVSRAQVEVARARSDKDDVERLRALEENVLAALMGIPASIFSIEASPLSTPPPVIPAGLPSELLCRRPDIAEAERNLAAAYRDIGVAYANFFPSLTLTASLGVESPFAHQLFSWKSRFWQVGWSLFQTVFDGGRNQANLEFYKASYCEAMANYQETVLLSFKDVEDSIANIFWYARRSVDLDEAVRAARVTLELSQMRYDRGLVNYLDVVDAERQLLETEQTSAIVLGNRYVSTVMLIKALGGGWEPCAICE